METTVNLQPLYSYSIWPIIILAIILFILTIYFIIHIIRANRKETEKIKIVKPKDIKSIKEKYIKKLETLDSKVDQRKIGIRHAYQELSSIIRFFIFEATDIKVQNYTLTDIEGLNMPFLTQLIQEYYAPEFSKQSMGNIKLSIDKTRKVVERWN